MILRPAPTTDPRVAEVIVWRRLDRPGHDAARLRALDGGWRLAGTASFTDRDLPCRLAYTVTCDAGWVTRAATVDGRIGSRPVHVDLARDARGTWRMFGTPVPAVAGCDDVDLSFTPATNTLPVRRLDLAVGQRTTVRAAWLDVSRLFLAPLDQVYARVDQQAYAYESDGGRFRADLRVNARGWITDYEGLWALASFESFQND